MPGLKTVYQPLFVCAGVFDTNRFAGDTLSLELHVINDLPDAASGLAVIAE